MAYSQWSNIRRRARNRVDHMLQSLQCNSDTIATQSDGEVNCSANNSELCDVVMPEEDSETESDDDGSDDVGTPSPDLASQLSDWAIQFGVSLCALSALLSILRVHHTFLPKDGRSLLKTKTQYVMEKLAGGCFYYFGVLKTLSDTLETLSCKVQDRHWFKLQLNIDGLPLFKSSSVQFWPILGMLKDFMKRPVLIALFCGQSKPTSLSEYLGSLINELKILKGGFPIGQKTFFMKVSSVICDAPARAYVKAIKGHTGYSGCDKCTQPGIYSNHRMTFTEKNAPLRTDEHFKSCSDAEHHLGLSPFSELDIGMVSCFPHDYMHLVCLGVVRKLLDLWMGSVGPRLCRISASQCSLISDRLTSLRAFVPSDFARKPRGLSERQRWKATELRQFLLYTGPVVLRDVLADEIYNNFMLLSVAIHVLASPSLCLVLNDFARTLLCSFVDHFSALYGSDFVVYNIHGLLHLCDDVKVHGHLDLISGFPYENYLQMLKKMVRKPHSPLTQVIRRVSEMRISEERIFAKQKNVAMGQHNEGPLPQMMGSSVKQFKKLIFDGVTIRTCGGDNCLRINNDIALVQNILLHEGCYYAVYMLYTRREHFFSYPVDSTDLGILVVSGLSPNLKCARLDETVRKCVRIPLLESRDTFVVFPLLHLN